MDAWDHRVLKGTSRGDEECVSPLRAPWHNPWRGAPAPGYAPSRAHRRSHRAAPAPVHMGVARGGVRGRHACVRARARRLVAAQQRDADRHVLGPRRGESGPARPWRRERVRRGRRVGPRGRGPAHGPVLLRAPPERPARRLGRRAAPALALPGDGALVLLGELPRDRARQHPGHRAHELGRRALQRLPRLGRHRDDDRRHRGRRLLRLPPAGARRVGRRARERLVRARAPRAALALGRCARDRARRALPRRRRHRRRHAARHRAHRGRRRAVPDPGPEQRGRRRRGDALMSVHPPVAASLELPHRVERAFRTLLYLAACVPLGALGLLALAGLALGALLAPVAIGLPLLTGAIAACRRLAELDRRAANRLLEAHIAPLPGRARVAGGAWQQARWMLADRQLWRIAALLALKLPLGALLLVAGVLPIALPAALLSLGAQGIGGYGEPTYLGPWRLDVPTGIVLCLLAVPAAVLAIALLEALGRGLSTLVHALLHSRRATGGPVREMLAESLGDRTLSIAYWLPDRQTFVDEAGRPVELPDPGSGRAWTAVERNGVRVAAIVHDAALDTGPELVQAAAAAAALALNNERLKADLRARVEELRVSRVRIVEAADAARRRLERDLHDGAQQQLVALALDLRLLKTRVRGTDAEPMVDGLAEKLAVALADLRELARGIHPAILTDRGLGPAIEALASRVPVPVESEVDVHERLSAPIEAAAYFVVAEALTNIVKYANAPKARVTVRRAADVVTVEVDDDGAGGARIGAGTGLRGLQDRLAALDGTVFTHNPRGDGTRLRAHIPLPGG